MEDPTETPGPAAPGDADVPPLPAPWRPSQAGGRPPLSGCGRPALFGCGGLLVLLAVASLLFVLKAERILEWVVSLSRNAIVEHLPADVTPSERARLEAAFDALPEALATGRLEPRALSRLQSELNIALSRSQTGSLTRQDVERLTETLESVAEATGGGARGEGQEPDAAPSTPPARSVEARAAPGPVEVAPNV